MRIIKNRDGTEIGLFYHDCEKCGEHLEYSVYDRIQKMYFLGRIKSVFVANFVHCPTCGTKNHTGSVRT